MIGKGTPSSPQTYGRGLEGLVVGDTSISRLDGSKGRLRFRGYALEDLVEHASFEEVSHLVLFGVFPDASTLSDWSDELAKWRRPPAAAFDVLKRIPRGAHPLAQFRTMLTVAACLIPQPPEAELEVPWRRPARILAWTAGLAAGAIRHLQGLEPVEPEEGLGYAASFLQQTLGDAPPDEEVRAFEASLVVQAEHGLHAAALAALTVFSTGADLGSAVLAGMGALSGARHGGANQLAFEVLEPLKTPDEARAYVQVALERGARFPGFGHRVYKCPDPRVKALEPHARALLEARGELYRWEIYTTLREEVEAALGHKGVYANVDSITGLLYHPLGLPVSAFPIPFSLAVQAGWMAHCLEYGSEGRMIDPGAVYVGEA